MTFILIQTNFVVNMHHSESSALATTEHESTQQACLRVWHHTVFPVHCAISSQEAQVTGSREPILLCQQCVFPQLGRECWKFVEGESISIDLCLILHLLTIITVFQDGRRARCQLQRYAGFRLNKETAEKTGTRHKKPSVTRTAGFASRVDFKASRLWSNPCTSQHRLQWNQAIQARQVYPTD